MNMRRSALTLALTAVLTGLGALALAYPGNPNEGASRASSPARSSFAGSRSPVIHMGAQSSGWHNRNFPSAKAAAHRTAVQPSWGHGWSSGWAQGSSAVRSSTAVRPERGSLFQGAQNQGLALVQHHHPYTPGYVRHKLGKIGVKSEPALIADRSEMLNTDRAHSSIAYPAHGPKGRAIRGGLLTPSGAGLAVLRAQMEQVVAPAFLAGIESEAGLENRSGRYYWHHASGFNYCHYQDAQAYQWYGFYLGAGFFWTRNYAGRWWWYDSGESRWCYYNDGFWWWQDPYHVADLFCYNGGAYIPANSADDQILVSLPETQDLTPYQSPDGSRVVKVVAGGEDAFLYDTDSPPAFDPIYLASGVASVQFSDTSNGRPLEIMLKLDDGSFDLFDAYGKPYNPGAYDADQATEQAPGDAVPQAPQP